MRSSPMCRAGGIEINSGWLDKAAYRVSEV